MQASIETWLSSFRITFYPDDLNHFEAVKKKKVMDKLQPETSRNENLRCVSRNTLMKVKIAEVLYEEPERSTYVIDIGCYVLSLLFYVTVYLAIIVW